MRPDERFQTPENAVLCWLATVTADGRPNVSPKEIFAQTEAGDLVIADIASGGSVANIRSTAAVCVSMIDIFLQRGHKFEGTAKIIAPDHPAFATLAAPLLRMTGTAFQIRHVIHVSVTRVTPILAPSYLFHPDRDEQALRADACRSYGVRPLHD